MAAATDDDHRAGLPFENHRFLGRDDGIAVDGKSGELARLGTGGEDDFFGVEELDGAVFFLTSTWPAPATEPKPLT